MNLRNRFRLEMLLVSLAGAGALASCIWFWLGEAEIRRLRAEPVAIRPAGAVYELPAPRVAPTPAGPVWEQPTAQSPGPGWLYEVFTPPEIRYDAGLKRFAVQTPEISAGRAPPWEFALLGVKPALFRLQLTGYFGEPDDYAGMFARPDLPGLVVARAGHRFAGLGLVLRELRVGKMPAQRAGAGPAWETAAQAVLWDEISGAEIVLDSRHREFAGPPLAVCRIDSGAGPAREFRAGDTVSVHDSVYRIEQVRLDPPEVVVLRQATGSVPPETRRLQPPDFASPAGTDKPPRPAPNLPSVLTINRN